ncbi:MAG: hypothetical protein ACRD9S_10375 [Pyrinomonadaceae bacterium]
MKLTQADIVTKLAAFRIPQDECSFRAFEIASILCDETVDWFPGKRYGSPTDALAEISRVLANGKMVIAWLDTGSMEPNNPTYRAIHCYFVFGDHPLRCFSVWENPGPTFYDDTFLRQKIAEAANFFQDKGGVELHVVPADNDAA